MIDTQPSDFYTGSFGGSHGYQTLAPSQVVRSAVCLQHWLRRRDAWAYDFVSHDRPNLWSLAPGTYELTVSFDQSKFRDVKPEEHKIRCKWTAPPVVFAVAGSPRSEPEELLQLIAEKARYESLRHDLVTRGRRDRAWRVVKEYGDTRLADLLIELMDGEYHSLVRRDGRGLREYELPRLVRAEGSDGLLVVELAPQQSISMLVLLIGAAFAAATTGGLLMLRRKRRRGR